MEILKPEERRGLFPLIQTLVEVVVLKPEGQPHAEDGHKHEKCNSVQDLTALPPDLGNPSFGSPAESHGRLVLKEVPETAVDGFPGA